MANTKTPKMFLSDLSNYTEIRRGLSPAMRKATLTKTELKSVAPDVKEQYIRQLNNWRQMGQGMKSATAHTQEGLSRVLVEAAGSKYYSPTDRAKIVTAGLKLKTMDPRAAEWEVREALNATGRLHDQAFYKAKYYLDARSWDPSQADDSMLLSIIRGGTLQSYGEDVVNATVKEYVKRMYGFTGTEAQEFEDLIEQESADIKASYYNDVLNIAKLITS